ncbi:CHAT domain-containing protein [Planctomycetota bacterium]
MRSATREGASAEGVLGLVRGFRAAGARSVVASLWPVDDHATRLLMERVYANLFADGEGRSAALALGGAARALRKIEVDVIDPRASMMAGKEVVVSRRPFVAPRHWAAFVAYGRLR